MDAERMQRIEEVYHDARERNPAERDAYLEEACAGDPELEAEVRGLLDAADDLDDFIAPPPKETFEQLGGFPERDAPDRRLSHRRRDSAGRHGRRLPRDARRRGVRADRRDQDRQAGRLQPRDRATVSVRAPGPRRPGAPQHRAALRERHHRRRLSVSRDGVRRRATDRSLLRRAPARRRRAAAADGRRRRGGPPRPQEPRRPPRPQAGQHPGRPTRRPRSCSTSASRRTSRTPTRRPARSPATG